MERESSGLRGNPGLFEVPGPHVLARLEEGFNEKQSQVHARQCRLSSGVCIPYLWRDKWSFGNKHSDQSEEKKGKKKPRSHRKTKKD
jgi:hypothetical protein